MDDNLISMKKIKTDIKSMKLFSLFMNSEQKNQLKRMEKELSNMEEQIELFNSRFSDSGWCAYDSMDYSLIKKSNEAYEKEDLIKAETVLLDYYKNDVNEIIHWLKASSDESMIRYNMIKKAFEDHFNE